MSYNLIVDANMEPLLYERAPIDVAAFSPLRRALFFRAMWGKDRSFLRFIREGRASARERGAISDIGESISLVYVPNLLG